MPLLADQHLLSSSHNHLQLEHRTLEDGASMASDNRFQIKPATNLEENRVCEPDGVFSSPGVGTQQSVEDSIIQAMNISESEISKKRKISVPDDQDDLPNGTHTSALQAGRSDDTTNATALSPINDDSIAFALPSTHQQAKSRDKSYSSLSSGNVLSSKPRKRFTVQTCATRMRRQELLQATDFTRVWPASDGRPPLGMYNRVVDCYRIAVLQALLSNPTVSNRFAITRRAHRDSAAHADNIRCLICDLSRLSEAIWSRSKEASENLKRVHVSIALQDKQRVYSWTRDRNEMADSAEFLRWLLSQVEPQLGSPIAHALFSTEEHGEWTCTVCGEISTMPPQQTSEILLEIKNLAQSDLRSALKQHFNEQLPALRCECCKTLSKPIRKRAIAEAPEVLFLTLKRFEQIQSLRTGAVFDRKIEKPFHYDATLDLSSFTERAERDRGPLRYELSAVVCHLGGFDGGHYIAYIAAPSGRVFRMDDDEVMAVEARQMLKPGNGFCPYILMYKRSDNTMDADTLVEDL